MGTHHAGSKSARRVQKDTAIRPEHEVRVRETSAKLRQLRPSFARRNAERPVALIARSRGRKDQFQAERIGLS